MRIMIVPYTENRRGWTVPDAKQNRTPAPSQEVEPVACWCHVCNRNRKVDIGGLSVPFAATRMIVCPECGNKRCPHASDHELSCTNSNEPNQLGSVYNAPSQEGHAAGPACSAPDEALIEEIVDNAVEQYKVFKGREEDALVFLATLTIREYIRRSAGKGGT